MIIKKALKVLLLTLTLSFQIKSSEDKFVMKCIPSGGQVPIKLYTSTGTQETDNVDHIDLHEGDIVYIPKASETTSFDTPVKVFSARQTGG